MKLPIVTLGAALLLGTVGPALALPSRTYVIAIGNNAVPTQNHEQLKPLRYADDDAVRFARLTRSWADKVYLLALLDADTQRRFPGQASASQMPSWATLKRTIRDLSKRIAQDRRKGFHSEVFFFFSGHGSRSQGVAFLALADGPLDQRRLYDQVLAKLPADIVHIVVDACYAAAVVRPRGGDTSAESVDVSEADVRAWTNRKTLRRFPHVGAIIATSASRQAHEWDIYQSGIFSHQVISGLRGAADVNGDKRIEYSELHAFIASANSAVKDLRAQLQVVIKAPARDLRRPIVDLRRLRNVGWATGKGAMLKHFHIEDQRGNRLLDMHAEPQHYFHLALPMTRSLLLQTQNGHESPIRLRLNKATQLNKLQLRPQSVSTRGAASALRAGLFVRPFGPSYYRGFADRDGKASVPMPQRLSEKRTRSKTPAWIAFASSITLALTSVTLGALAAKARSDFNSTQLQRPAAEARQRYDRMRYSAIGTGVASVLSAGIGVWAFPWE